MSTIEQRPVVNYGPQSGPQWEFLQTEADICLYGGQAGGGKSYGLLLDQLRWIEHKGYTGIIFRRTSPELDGSGSIWEEAGGIFPHYGANMRSGNVKSARFPSGALVEFRHLQYEKDKLAHQGKQYAVIGFDEVTHFTESQFWYLVSRNRSVSGIKPYVRGTCNPDADSWVRQFIEWWIDPDTGLAIPERSGVLRWMVRDVESDAIVWGDTRSELANLPGAKPISVTFIPSSVYDNPALLLNDPDYIDKLNALPMNDRKRLFGANWNIGDRTHKEWPAHYFFDHIWTREIPPAFEHRVIAVDWSRGKTGGDYSVCCFVGYRGAKYWVDSQVRRRPAEKLCDDVIDIWLRRGADLVYIEGNGAQELLVNLIKARCKERNVMIPPVVARDSTTKKEDRIRRLGPHFENQVVEFLDTEDNRLLIQQASDFPLADFDDGVDCLEMAIRSLNEVGRVKHKQEQMA